MTKRVNVRRLALLVPALVLPTAAGAAATPLPPPAVPGVAPVPGARAGVAQPSPTMGILDVTPDQGIAAGRPGPRALASGRTSRLAAGAVRSRGARP